MQRFLHFHTEFFISLFPLRLYSNGHFWIQRKKGSSVWNSIRKLDAVPAYRTDGDSALFGEVLPPIKPLCQFFFFFGGWDGGKMGGTNAHFRAHGLAADAADGDVLFGAEGLEADRAFGVLAVEHFGEVDAYVAALHAHGDDPPALDPVLC